MFPGWNGDRRDNGGFRDPQGRPGLLGLDTSVIVPWLRENYDAEVVCFTADIGQGEEVSGLEARAPASGASRLVLHDVRQGLATDYLFRLLRAQPGSLDPAAELSGAGEGTPIHTLLARRTRGEDRR